MKIEFDKKKGTEALTNLAQNAVSLGKSAAELGKKAADGAKDGISIAVEKVKTDNQERKLKKLNPLFPEQYNSASFNLPNMIVIVDDAVRKDEELCEGAIGWLGKEKDVEVLYLYDEAVPTCGLRFVPAPNCDAVYYVDNFDRKRFVRVDCIFGQAHEERMAELKHIALCLGAKRCHIRIAESEKKTETKSKTFSLKGSMKGFTGGESAEHYSASSHMATREGSIVAEFEGSDIPQMPTLKWFAHNSTIQGLIEARCERKTAKCETIKLFGSSHATMSQKTAQSIDSALVSMGNAHAKNTMFTQAEEEHSSSLEFYVEF